MGSLTDIKIRNLKPQERPYQVADGDGLILEVRPSGQKAWLYRYRVHGRQENSPWVTTRKFPWRAPASSTSRHAGRSRRGSHPQPANVKRSAACQMICKPCGDWPRPTSTITFPTSYPPAGRRPTSSKRYSPPSAARISTRSPRRIAWPSSRRSSVLAHPPWPARCSNSCADCSDGRYLHSRLAPDRLNPPPRDGLGLGRHREGTQPRHRRHQGGLQPCPIRRGQTRDAAGMG